ncbi:MAG: PIN domain-containing protein [Verrucomicrobiales bacterium]|nr:PIN domain-containing protein [Verrucomicrobiales bacterium]
MKIVDTSLWIEFLRRRGDPEAKHAVARLLEADQAAYSCPIRFELLAGVRPEEEADLAQALGFIHHLRFEPEDWCAAARLERQIRNQGVSVPRNDLFVATIAIRTGIPVACRDAHFDAIQGVAGDKLVVEQL